MLAAKQIQSRKDLDVVRPPTPPADAMTALGIYNSMGGEIDYAQLPFLIALHDVEDVAVLNRYLLAIRNTINEHQAAKHENIARR